MLEVAVTSHERATFVPVGACQPHRHDYHELSWVRSGSARHLIDGRAYEMGPGNVAVIARGQVHCLEHARGVRGAAVRFHDEVLADPGRERTRLCWLLEPCRPRMIAIPPGESSRVELMLDALARETRRPADGFSRDSQRHLLATLLLWMGRWSRLCAEAASATRPAPSLYERFLTLLERDFARRHAVQYYAGTLGVTQIALSRASIEHSGRTTKDLILDRVMLEATRLLRYTDMTVSEIAFQVGFGDPLYFSRAFKRRSGLSPLTYRTKVHGYGEDFHSALPSAG